MTYSVGGLIEATDFNGFVSTNSANVNGFWGTGATDSGWGQTAISTVSAGGTVAATNWASLVNTLSSAGSQTGTTITSRSAPTSGSLISVLSNINTDITNIKTNRGNAVASGTEYGTFTGSPSVTAATGSGQATWTLTFTHNVTFASSDAARYFFNAGGIIKVKYGKSSTGTDIDADWNTFAGLCGTINFTGRVNGAAQTIAGTSYTGTTRVGGTGGTQTTLATTTGFYNLTAGAAATTLFQLNNATSPYTGEYIKTTVALDATGAILTFVTTWYQPAVTGAGTTCNISGGTATTSPSTTITGTAPTTLVTYVPPSTTYLTASWGTPTIECLNLDYLVVAGGGGGGSQIAGGGGAGGLLYSTAQPLAYGTYTVTVGAGGAAGTGSNDGGIGSNSVFGSFTASGGGAGQGGELNRTASPNGGSGGGQGRTGGSRGGTVGSGTAGQGNNGGSGSSTGGTDNLGSGGGGGGAGAVGGNASGSTGGNGGNGSAYSISGSSVTYAGGGAGGAYNGTGGTGGTGGGGNGGSGSSGVQNGTNNTGGGGGGAGYPANTGGSGGSGIVIIKYPSSLPALTSISVGLTYSSTNTGGYRTYTFTAGTGTVTL